MTKRQRRDPYTQIRAVVPERKLSESLLDLAAPLLESLGPVPERDEALRAIELAIMVWNLHVMAGPIWEKPHYLAEALKTMHGPQSAPELAATFDLLSSRWRAKFSLDPRCVGKWSFDPVETGRCDLVCESRLPQGVEPLVPPPAEKRIALGGRFLDEVRIILKANTFLSFPVDRHLGEVGDGTATIRTMMPTAVQLFADGVLKPVGGAPVDVVIGLERLGPMVLREVRCDDDRGHNDAATLVFKRLSSSTATVPPAG